MEQPNTCIYMSDYLIAWRDAFISRGPGLWHKGIWGYDNDGGLCIGRLGLAVAWDTNTPAEIQRAAYETFAKILGSDDYHHAIPTFNDNPNTTWGDVVRAFDAAIYVLSNSPQQESAAMTRGAVTPAMLCTL